MTLIKIIVIFAVIAPLSGCALFGSDVQGLSEIKEAYTRTFDKNASTCYELTTKALAKWKTVVFQQNKDDYIVAIEFEKVFRSCINTTELGIFFTETGPNKTEVKVTSLNYNLSQFIAPYLFNYIEKDGNVPPEEELKPAAVISTGSPFKKNR